MEAKPDTNVTVTVIAFMTCCALSFALSVMSSRGNHSHTRARHYYGNIIKECECNFQLWRRHPISSVCFPMVESRQGEKEFTNSCLFLKLFLYRFLRTHFIVSTQSHGKHAKHRNFIWDAFISNGRRFCLNCVFLSLLNREMFTILKRLWLSGKEPRAFKVLRQSIYVRHRETK